MAACNTCGLYQGQRLHRSPGSPRDIPAERVAQRARLAEVETKLDHLQTHLDALRRERTELKDELSSIIYPILTVPTEILSEIFLRCLPAERRVPPSQRNAPLLLTQICREFRQISMSVPALWSYLVIDFRVTQKSTISAPERGELIPSWLTQAGGSPLHLTLRDPWGSAPSSVAATIASTSSQIQRLELDIPLEQLERLHDRLGPLPTLRALSFTSTQKFYHLPQQLFFRDAPLLSELHISGHVGINAASIEPSILGDGLEVLELAPSILFSEFSRILRDFPRLRRLAVNVNGVEQGLLPAYPLESLAINSYAGLLNSLTLPNLCRLEVLLNDEPNIPIFADFLARSRCTLDHLSVFSSTVYDSGPSILAPALRLVPSISSLTFDYSPRGRNVVYSIFDPSCPDGDVLPNLTTLRITETQHRRSFTPIIDMLSSRRKRNPNDPGARLVEFELYIMDGEGDSSEGWSEAYTLGVQQAFAALVAEGLKFHVAHRPNHWWIETPFQDLE